MSDAERLRHALESEQSKPFPDEDVLYAIKLRMPYANIVDVEKLDRGNDKLSQLIKEIAKDSTES
jgi:hypothetical protein